MRPPHGAEHHQKHRFEHSYLEDWYSGISHCSVSNSVAKWALEALALPGSISVVLDCDSTPEQCSQMFEEAVVQDAVWQKVQEECFARQLLPPPVWEWRSMHSTNAFICQDFPKIVQDIVNGTSVISCNFPINEFSDINVEQLIWDHRGMSIYDWEEKMYERSQRPGFQPVAPLPNLGTILRQNANLERSSRDSPSRFQHSSYGIEICTINGHCSKFWSHTCWPMSLTTAMQDQSFRPRHIKRTKCLAAQDRCFAAQKDHISISDYDEGGLEHTRTIPSRRSFTKQTKIQITISSRILDDLGG
ncbi:hypothetical protein B0T26DRAFT_284222 [Lasiosphaeria miniovina]|uniref:Uncharacterized protein n=1 Tax=Lasiosphaeria miniovina TaxID=1954250 RepID=A0AA40AJX3_9PEZI|nr:uncharacterized protein B0T26DRAFT_284222 [Lasiosphaeria miniovina]KAK0717145.1 hypothetical protein B0T26DRAFT_284222 [Lasiosphaeria miniovina]